MTLSANSETRFLCAVATACYAVALSLCIAAVYALLALSLTAFDHAGRGLYLAGSQF